jgi:hypothetical protein
MPISEEQHKLAWANSLNAEKVNAKASAFSLGQRKVSGPTFAFGPNRVPYVVGVL